LNCAARCGPVHPTSPLSFCHRCVCQSVCAALLRPAQVPGSYIASASQVLVSALVRRYGLGSLAHRAGSAVACGSACPPCSWQLWHTPATAKLHNAALLSVSASQSQAPFVAATASRPSGESNRRYAKLPTLERSHSRRRFPVVGTPYAPSSARPCGCRGIWALVRRCALCCWSGACGQSCGVCPRPPLCFAAARHQPCALVCPSAPRGGSLSPRALVVGFCYSFCSWLRKEYGGYRPNGL
jgi:hypothetical protein